jgi:hypothetical protein
VKRNNIGLGISLAAVAVAVASGEPGQGIHVGSWAFNPFVEFNGVYDSNINQTPSGTEDDVFLDSALGLRMGYTAFELDFSGLGFLSERSYDQAKDKNFEAAGEILKLKYGARDRTVVEADQSFRTVEDNDPYASEAAVGGVSPDSILDAVSRSRRDINQGGLSFGRNLTDKMELDVGYRFDAIDYHLPELVDLKSQALQIETAHKLTDKTAGLITLKGGVQELESPDESADYYAARLGLKTRGTDKLSFKATAGVQQYNRPAGKDAETGFNYDGMAQWLATDKMTVQAGGRNGIQLSSLYVDNAAEFSVFWLGATYRVTPAFALSANGVYRVDDYLDPVAFGGRMVNRKDTGEGVRVRGDYLTRAKFMRLFSELTYDMIDSTIQDYDESRVSVGVQLQY